MEFHLRISTVNGVPSPRPCIMHTLCVHYLCTSYTLQVLNLRQKHKSFNKGVADLSIVKYYNYNKFSHYTTSCTMLRTKRTRAELARVEQGLESRDSESSISDSENKEL